MHTPPGSLYVVATPIGNLGDITQRALEVLKSVDLVAAEDTRHSGQLLSRLGIAAKFVALHEHNELQASPRLIADLQSGKNVAIITDAGTPAISDPGTLLVAAAHEAGIRVVPVPGASAVICALSAAGIVAPHWLFYGFLPAKASHRRTALQTLAALPYALIFYEAPHRITECVEDLAAVLGGERRITFARELTKLFEAIHNLPLAKAGAWLAADPNRQKGEFVLIVEGASVAASDEDQRQLRDTLTILLEELPLKQAAHIAARLTGIKKNTCYKLALDMRDDTAAKDVS
ncbi:16S rRNA (cytidine(1402)-2'-O)-methyltransferase [Sulfuriferula sp. AH1]|uniref:16S rRNA (cytidine(1402)-2'-O)-methyltransferase n=1 Tax=Sulfuriferula sp. AH1 TaxID=1985873 RepID=UPI000B3B23E4|nr:16S rRNA (cytidine(1402)-2'-O)-methyltransferase [Sulfuriferula sp. AH1]ARU30476.1 16S rRNA (cytidine(1402)-2'-O)-methyltransferase [Sulfuriferula sp. AH1]